MWRITGLACLGSFVSWDEVADDSIYGHISSGLFSRAKQQSMQQMMRHVSGQVYGDCI